MAQLEIQTWTHDIKNIQRVDQNTKDTVSTFSVTAKKHSHNEKAINLIKLQEGKKKGLDAGNQCSERKQYVEKENIN